MFITWSTKIITIIILIIIITSTSVWLTYPHMPILRPHIAHNAHNDYRLAAEHARLPIGSDFGILGSKVHKKGDSLPWTPMNRRAKFDASSFILGGEIRNRTNTQINTQTNSNRYIHTLPIGMYGYQSYWNRPGVQLYRSNIDASLNDPFQRESFLTAASRPVTAATGCWLCPLRLVGWMLVDFSGWIWPLMPKICVYAYRPPLWCQL